MRGNLGVRISAGDTDKIVTQRTRGLRFRKTAPGGHHSASAALSVPRDSFPDLGPADRMYVYDSRTGRTVWEGYTENPGALDGPSGEGFDLSAMGGMVLASDRAERLPYIDQSLNSWRTDDYHPQAASGTGDASQFPGDAGTRAGAAGLYCQFNPGQPITTSSQTGVVYDPYLGSPMTFGGIAGWKDAGQTDANFDHEWVLEPYVGGDPTLVASMNVIGSASSGFANGTTFPIGKTAVTYRLIRTAGGSVTVATDNVWGAFGELFVFGHLKDRYGSLRTMNSTLTHLTLPTSSVATAAYLLASDVAEDLLGRMLTQCDPTSAVIETTTADIDQLAYLEAAKAAQVLDDLLMHEPDFLWEILETVPNGLHRFNFRAWPTTPRYEISTQDGYNAPGGEVDLCNRIAVDWTNTKGVKKTTVVGAFVPELGDKNPILAGALDPSFIGRIKDAEPVTLPDGRGSLKNAQRVGAQILAARNDPQRAATATVRRPIVDHLRGGRVWPWEIEPGYLVRVRETGEDLRLTEMEYVDDDGAATLTLGTPVLTQDQILAKVRK